MQFLQLTVEILNILDHVNAFVISVKQVDNSLLE